ncbi:hypothetical protein [Streptomyces sp. NPDC057939]|uniref:hypothetical protein n=1 Tax=Streptomyces sp. NPDC057939 TaxID=3346284 RepID=UPI0036EAB86D
MARRSLPGLPLGSFASEAAVLRQEAHGLLGIFGRGRARFQVAKVRVENGVAHDGGVAPHLLADFDRDRAAGTARARTEVSAAPLRTFTEAWAVEVAIARHPETAARLRALESRAGEVTDLCEARDITAEISRIRRAAATEAGIAIAAGPAS